MKAAFADVQHIVLAGGKWKFSRQLVIGSAEPSQLPRFLNRLLAKHPPTAAGDDKPALQLSLGFSRRGLEHARVPAYVLACFAAKAPAFFAGAALRAASHAGSSGADAPTNWDPAFDFTALDAVLSLQATTENDLNGAVKSIEAIAGATQLPLVALPTAAWPRREDDLNYVHFGFLDGVSQVGIEGWTDEKHLKEFKPFSRHAAGEFVLGHPQTSGANPWLATGGRSVWPAELRAFFHNGSFGALRHIQQYVSEFEAFLDHASERTELDIPTLRAKLCGRTDDGRPAGMPDADPMQDFDYQGDDAGERCPFGAHVRRMNPREGEVAHTQRRPLLRRGMPYDRVPPSPASKDADSRGLMGLFFCASIEDQFEHLLAQWSERVPLGSGDRGSARDPFIGAHEAGDGPLYIPVRGGSISVDGLRRFTRTRGTAYLFYPSLSALQRIARNEVFADTTEAER